MVDRVDKAEELGDIDLSRIDLTLKDEKFVSSLNPAIATNPACPVRNLVFRIRELGISNGAGSKIFQGWLGESNFTLYPSDNADAKRQPYQRYPK